MRGNVSVPYRGATFLNWDGIATKNGYGFRPLSGSYISQYQNRLSMYSGLVVSVPYRGATFLNALKKATGETNRFPSPIGELHFSILLLRSTIQTENCFRPLSGSYISQLCQQILKRVQRTVSVPYRGATFLNTIPATPCPVWDE